MPGLTSFFKAFRQLMRGTKNGERKNSGEKRREKTRLYNFACNISTNGGQRKHINLENCLLYLSSIMSQFIDFINCLVFDFTFFLRDNEHTITSNVRSLRENLKPPS